MTDILIAMLAFVAALMAAAYWTVHLQRTLTTTLKRLEKVERRLHSAKLTLTSTKQTNEELMAESMFLKAVITDVAKGEAHVWIGEDGDIRATRTATGETPIH